MTNTQILVTLILNGRLVAIYKNYNMTVLMPLIGYARVSTEDQTPLPQSQALKSAGCAEIHEEQASGGNRARPVLARVLERIGKGDTLLVVRIDRLARSLSHLLEVIERLQAKGAFFRSIRTRSTPDPRKANSRCRFWAPRPSSSGR
jgi:DNA invertase Pin-like site-specific DNA recombinase